MVVGVWDVVVVGAVWVNVRRRVRDPVFAKRVKDSVVEEDETRELDSVNDAVRSTDNVAVRMPVVEGAQEKVIVGEPDAATDWEAVAIKVCDVEAVRDNNRVIVGSDSVIVTVSDRVALRVEQVQG